MKILFKIVILLCLVSPIITKSQEDSTQIFTSPHNLLTTEQQNEISQSAGLDILITEWGFGAGFNYTLYRDNLQFCFGTSFSGLKNSFEYSNYLVDGEYRVLNKINRVYRIPMTFSVQYEPFKKYLDDSFRPFVSLGTGASLILTSPYEKTFFESLNYLENYIKPTVFLGIGSFFSNNNQAVYSVYFRYYYVPIPANEVFSLNKYSITEGGGLFFGISVGMGW